MDTDNYKRKNIELPNHRVEFVGMDSRDKNGLLVSRKLLRFIPSNSLTLKQPGL